MSPPLTILFTLACLAAPLEAQVEAPANRPPNILFFLVDDVGWGDPSCYGHPQLRTPSIDRLAAQGTLFTSFYANAPVCTPSRVGFLTGRFPSRDGWHAGMSTPARNLERGVPDWLDPEQPTIAPLLQGVGYRTAHFGKWHLGKQPGAPDLGAYGFDEHRSTNSRSATWPEAEEPYFRARSTALIVDEAIRFIEADRERPFYLQCWTLLVHATLDPTPEQLAPVGSLAVKAIDYPDTKQVYYASLLDLDAQLGRLLTALDRLGVAKDTIVVFTSDNGPEDIVVRGAAHSGIGSTGPFRGRKRSLYEGGVRMPFLVRWPEKVAAGRVEDTSILAGTDLLPTFCALAGVELPNELSLDGEDVSDILLGGSRPRRAPLFWEWRNEVHGHVLNRSPRLAMRDGPWKLLMNPDRSRIELYDLPNDPTELRDQSATQPEVVKRMSRALLEWSASLPPGKSAANAGKDDYPWPGSGR